MDDRNLDLSPWQAPAVFGKDAFGGGASDTLSAMLPLCEDKAKTYYIGGYSLAGLFALWAAYQTDTFKGVAAVSPSVQRYHLQYGFQISRTTSFKIGYRRKQYI